MKRISSAWPAQRLAMALCLAASGVFAPGCLFFRPLDHTEVTVRDIPQTTNIVCMAAETPWGLSAMDLYVYKLTYSSIRAASGAEVYSNQREFLEREVKWPWMALRVGIVTHDSKNGWAIAWFDGANGRRSFGMPLLAGWEWDRRLAQADHIEPLSSAQVHALGLSELNPTLFQTDNAIGWSRTRR